MTDGELKSALSASQYAESGRERAKALNHALAEIRRRGHHDHLGIRYSVGKYGALRRGLPRDAPGSPQTHRGEVG